MPAGFYWDGILFIILGVVGLIGSLFTQLSLVPGWRARVKAMRENEADKEEVAQALTDSDEKAESEGDESDDEANDDVEEDDGSEDLETDEGDDEDYDEDEIDIGSFIGLMLEDEEVFGTIIEFDDDEGLVTIEEDGTGDLVTGYQEDMFIED